MTTAALRGSGNIGEREYVSSYPVAICYAVSQAIDYPTHKNRMKATLSQGGWVKRSSSSRERNPFSFLAKMGNHQGWSPFIFNFCFTSSVTVFIFFSAPTQITLFGLELTFLSYYIIFLYIFAWLQNVRAYNTVFVPSATGCNSSASERISDWSLRSYIRAYRFRCT